jgi:hypothetical protein
MIRCRPKEKDRMKCGTWIVLCPFLLKYFNLLKTRKYKPQFIINFDEVSTLKVNSKTTYQLTVKENTCVSVCKSENLFSSTVLFITSADGEALPSVLLIPYQKIPEELRGFNSPVFRIFPSPNGFMTRELLEVIMKEIIIKGINERRDILGWKEEAALLVVDGHTSRNSEIIYKLCAENNVDLICIPSHVSDVIQPHDLQLNAVFANNLIYNDNIELFSSMKEKRESFVLSVKDAISKTLVNKGIRNTWKLSGLYPFEPFKILQKKPVFTPSFTKSKSKTTNQISGKVLVNSSVIHSI